jgi:hypothetical protein
MSLVQWKTLNERPLISKARLVYKIIHRFAPAVLTEIFSSVTVVIPHDHDCSLRNSDMHDAAKSSSS